VTDAATRETQRQAHAGDPRAALLALRRRLRVEPGLRARVEVAAFLGDALSREVLVGPAPPGEFFVGLDTLATGAASLAARLPSPGVEEVTCVNEEVTCVNVWHEPRCTDPRPCPDCTGTLTRPRDPATEIMLHVAHDVGRAVLPTLECECPHSDEHGCWDCRNTGYDNAEGPLAEAALDALRHHLATWTVESRGAWEQAVEQLVRMGARPEWIGLPGDPVAALPGVLTAAARALRSCDCHMGRCSRDCRNAVPNRAAVHAALLPLAARVREGWPL